MIALTSVRGPRPSGSPRTKERSIFSTLTGNSPSRASDEWPVPKSSIASWIPCMASAAISSLSPGRGTMASDSVISSAMRAGSQPGPLDEAHDRSGADLAADVGRDVDRHVEVVAIALSTRRPAGSPSRIAHSLSGRIRPVCSASGMNSSGPIAPRSASVQRASASTPIMRPVASSTIGW